MTACLACDHQLEHDAMLCTTCTTATSARLGRMPGLYALLAAFLAPGATGAQTGRTRPAEAPLPVSGRAVDLRGINGICGVLEDWRAAMQADRGWSRPAVHGTYENRVRAAARGLQLNLDWIAQEWPAAGDFAREIRALERDALSVIDPPPDARRVGTCPDPCGAVLRVPAGTSTVVCSWCGTTYPPSRWIALVAA
ncbi:hypothetical protein [Streptomyces sp. MJP52]|uniref:hypothetical protein n=1 Tax=Streptomyces sp. MJP52 TaxID=2940555 RepID=UPI0024731F23|nr:hypothetical protein [Streptomyces sp. MJP52]MDH6226233.1 hypothetical protein [Streptomyces sp. MJP52]